MKLDELLLRGNGSLSIDITLRLNSFPANPDCTYVLETTKKGGLISSVYLSEEQMEAMLQHYLKLRAAVEDAREED